MSAPLTSLRLRVRELAGGGGQYLLPPVRHARLEISALRGLKARCELERVAIVKLLGFLTLMSYFQNVAVNAC